MITELGVHGSELTDYEPRNTHCPLPGPDMSVVSALQSHPGIDAGELLLVGALAATPDAFLLTGDKRALTALAKTNAIPGCRERFICVEQLVWHALDQLGPSELTVRMRFLAFRDEAARAIVGREGAKSDGDLRDGLRSYLHALDRDAPTLLTRGFGL